MEKYKTTLKITSFLHLELKKAASLYLQGFPLEEIKNKAKYDNLFLFNTKNRKSEIASTIVNRLKVLDSKLIESLAEGTLETSKQIALYSILKTDRLFYEFMQEVYKEKSLLGEQVITDKDFNIFFHKKAEQDQTVASWKDYTYYKLKQIYKKILIDAGFTKRNKKALEITKPFMDETIKKHLVVKGDKQYLEAMLGEIIIE